ncbi:MAG: PqqD family protein [Candidatus Cryptobacteroides sp.]
MRINDNLRLRKIGSRSMVVKEVEGEVNMTDVFTLNPTASDIWTEFSGKDFTKEDLVSYLVDNYEVARERAAADVAALLSQWKEFGLIDG